MEVDAARVQNGDNRDGNEIVNDDGRYQKNPTGLDAV
jgi:hypothetical protein